VIVVKEIYDIEEYFLRFNGVPMEPNGVFVTENEMRFNMLALESQYDVKVYHNAKTGFYSIQDTESGEKYTVTRIEYNGEVGYDLAETFVCEKIARDELDYAYIGVNYDGIMDFTHAFPLLKRLGYPMNYDIPTDTFYIETDKGMQTIKGEDGLYDTNVLK